MGLEAGKYLDLSIDSHIGRSSRDIIFHHHFIKRQLFITLVLIMPRPPLSLGRQMMFHLTNLYLRLLSAEFQ